MRRLWLVRLGKFGETEPHALTSGELVTGWILPDVSAADSREAFMPALEQTSPDEKPGTLKNWAVQLNQLKNSIKPGDLTATPLKTTGKIAIGEVVGDFYQSEGHPARRVRWLNVEVDRAKVRQDLLYSLGATQTVAEISRNEALARFEVIASTGSDPGPARTIAHKPRKDVGDPEPNGESELATIDIGRLATDQIERRLAAAFAGHGFTELIAAILRAQGYQARVSPPGSDRGVDIVAGQGALGFDGPRLVVQVKSGDVVVDQPTLQGLIGCIEDTRAEHGLLVSWGGFKNSVNQRVNELFFRVRLWGRAEILAALFDTYDRLPESIRAELPLRKVWAIVPEED